MTKKISEKIDIITQKIFMQICFLQSYQNFNILLINDFSNEEVPMD